MRDRASVDSMIATEDGRPSICRAVTRLLGVLQKLPRVEGVGAQPCNAMRRVDGTWSCQTRMTAGVDPSTQGASYSTYSCYCR